MKRVIEKYNCNRNCEYALHNDVLQNQALNDIENSINSNNKRILRFINAFLLLVN